MNDKGDIVTEYRTKSGPQSAESAELDFELGRLYDMIQAETMRTDESIERVIRELESGL